MNCKYLQKNYLKMCVLNVKTASRKNALLRDAW